MKIIFTSLLLLISFYSMSQGTQPTKKQLLTILKSSIDQSSKKNISIGSGAWIICNTANSFYSADTIKLYNNVNYFYQINRCCDFIDWTFYRKDAFVQSTFQICNEPASHSVMTKYYKINVMEENKSVYLIITGYLKKTEKLKLLNIAEVKLANNNIAREITLKRIKQ